VQDSYSETDSRLAGYGITHLVCNPKFHHFLHKNPLMAPVKSQVNPARIQPYFVRFILILYSHLRLGFSIGIPPISSTDHNFYICQILEKNAVAMRQYISYLLIDLQTAYGSLRREALYNTLTELVYPWN
jgi:hypothetical protein